MMKFNKKQRMEAYTYALFCLLAKFPKQGVCGRLTDYCIESNLYRNRFYFSVHHFPEFLAQKPINKSTLGFWFTKRRERINAVCRAIELLEQKQK